LPGIFYIPTNAELNSQDIRFIGDHFEIGGHTASHPADMKLLSDADLYSEIVENKGFLESVIGRPITSFAYPKGKYDQRVVDAVAAAGYKGARTVDVGNILSAEDPYRTRPSFHIQPNRKEYGGMNWLCWGKDLFAKALEVEDSVFHIWGHSWEVDQYGLWNELDAFFADIKETQRQWQIETKSAATIVS